MNTRQLIATATILTLIALGTGGARMAAEQLSPQLGARFSILGMQRFGNEVVRVFRDSADGRCFVVLQESIGPIVPCEAK